MVLDAAQARLAGKMMRDPGARGDLWIENDSGRNVEDGRSWDDFGEPFLRKDGFTSVMSAILSKADGRRQ